MQNVVARRTRSAAAFRTHRYCTQFKTAVENSSYKSPLQEWTKLHHEFEVVLWLLLAPYIKHTDRKTSCAERYTIFQSRIKSWTSTIIWDKYNVNNFFGKLCKWHSGAAAFGTCALYVPTNVESKSTPLLMADDNSTCHTRIQYILKYIKIENSLFKLWKYFSVLYWFLNKNAPYTYFKKHLKISRTKLFNGIVYMFDIKPNVL